MSGEKKLRNLDTELLLRLFDDHTRKGEPWTVLSRVYESRTGRYIAPFRLSTLARHAHAMADSLRVDETPDAVSSKIDELELLFCSKTAENVKKCSKIGNFVKKTSIFAIFLSQMAFFGQKIAVKLSGGLETWKNA